MQRRKSDIKDISPKSLLTRDNERHTNVIFCFIFLGHNYTLVLLKLMLEDNDLKRTDNVTVRIL